MKTQALAMLAAALLASPALAADQAPSPYETAVHKLVTAWFAGVDLGNAETQLATDLGGVPDAAKDAYGALQAGTAKLTADAARGLASYDTEAKVDFAVALAASDTAVSRSALSRLNTALTGGGVATTATDDLTQLQEKLDALLQTLGTL